MFAKYKIKIMSKIKYINSWRNKGKFARKNKNRIYLIGTPSHGNLGDHAIALGEVEFIKRYFHEYELIEITEDDFNESILPIKRTVKNDDIFFLTGGGNLGDVYILDEKIRRKTIQLFSNNKIIIFPQTIYFSNSIYGHFQQYITKIIYSMHKKLTICLREEYSLEIAKKIFSKNKLLLAPDMALFLNTYCRKADGNNILVLLRSDSESTMDESTRMSLVDDIKNIAKNTQREVILSDTTVKKNIHMEEREREFLKLIEIFHESKTAITDRLHGMILAMITGTPCVVLPNYNYKVKGVYDAWLKEIAYIYFCDEKINTNKAVSHLKNPEKYYMSDKIKAGFERLVKCINEEQ